MMETEPKGGTLYIVGTPIGNLEDMTFRAIKILKNVDRIAAEDTRHTGKLLQHFQIATPQISYHEHNRQQRIPELLKLLQQGLAIALVSDAGMPGISDPGYELVNACWEVQIPVVPIPGGTAVTTALSACGLPTRRFTFEGFLPPKTKERQQILSTLQSEPRTLVFYEAPHRLKATLADMAAAFGETREIVLARELTKRFEQFWRGTIQEAIAHTQQQEPMGEYTLIVAGREVTTPILSEDALKQELVQLLAQGISRSEASRQLAQLTQLPRRAIYQLALSLPDQEIEDAEEPSA